VHRQRDGTFCQSDLLSPNSWGNRAVGTARYQAGFERKFAAIALSKLDLQVFALLLIVKVEKRGQSFETVRGAKLEGFARANFGLVSVGLVSVGLVSFGHAVSVQMSGLRHKVELAVLFFEDLFALISPESLPKR